MGESSPFQQQRQILREFRQAVTARQQQEQEANQRWQTEKQAADRALEQTLTEAKKQHDREKARLTQSYQTDRRTAEETRKAAQAQAERLLKETESEVRSRYQAERKQADTRLTQTQREAEKQQEQERTQATEHYDGVVKAAEEDWAQAQKRAAEAETTSQDHLKKCQNYLIEAGLSTAPIPGEILPVAPEGITEDADPKPMLEQSLEAVWQARIAVRGAVDALLRWRETWRRRRNWAIGIAVTAVFAVLIGLSYHSAQVQEAARHATATAYYPTMVAMATGTAQAEATAQARATATVQAILAARPTSKAVTVYANREWQETGMFVIEGERIRIQYSSGKWSWACCDSSTYVDANGIIGSASYSDNVILACNHSALIAQVANSRFCVGTGSSQVVSHSGWIELRINDRVTGDNASAIEVIIEVE